jgi:hypothetical protein
MINFIEAADMMLQQGDDNPTQRSTRALYVSSKCQAALFVAMLLPQAEDACRMTQEPCSPGLSTTPLFRL